MQQTYPLPVVGSDHWLAFLKKLFNLGFKGGIGIPRRVEPLDRFAFLVNQEDFKIPSYVSASRIRLQKGVHLSSLGSVNVSLFEKEKLLVCPVERRF